MTTTSLCSLSDAYPQVSPPDPVTGIRSFSSGARSEALLARLAADCLCSEWDAVGEAMSQLSPEAGAIDPTIHFIFSQAEFLALAALRLSEAEVTHVLHPALTTYWAALPLSVWERAVGNYRSMWISLLGDRDGEAQAGLSLRGRLRFLRDAMPVLAVSMDWMTFCHLGALSASIVDMARDQASTHLIAEWRQGEGCLLQRVLLRTHGSAQIWPSSMIGKRAVAAFRKRVPTSLFMRLAPAMGDTAEGIFWPHPNDHKATVINLPLLMGFWSASGMAMDWWYRQGRMHQVMAVYAFDPLWFQTAYGQGVKFALAYGLPSLNQVASTS